MGGLLIYKNEALHKLEFRNNQVEYYANGEFDGEYEELWYDDVENGDIILG